MTHYTVYCTTNRINGKYYIGVHKTSNLDDGYMGSGKLIKASLKKYGVAAFDKEICCVYSTASEAFAKEKLLVRVYRRNKLCMNLANGGAGGWDYANSLPRKSHAGCGKKAVESRRRHEAEDIVFGARLRSMRESNGRKAGAKAREYYATVISKCDMHGTLSAYRVRGCRCALCRDHMSAYMREYKRTRKRLPVSLGNSVRSRVAAS